MTYIAARAGYDFVSYRIILLGTANEPNYALAESKAMLRQTKTALAETGLKVHDIEVARIADGIDPKSYVPALETAADLGARQGIGLCGTCMAMPANGKEIFFRSSASIEISPDFEVRGARNGSYPKWLPTENTARPGGLSDLPC